MTPERAKRDSAHRWRIWLAWAELQEREGVK
jgi:hypothetical protein